MYLPSPVSGWLADRYGRLPVIAGGGLALLAAGVLAARARRQHAADRPRTRPARRGLEPRLVGGSALLTDAIAPERRAQTQGAADLVMGLTAISGNLVAGPLFHAGAFGVLGAGAAALGAFLIVLAARARAPWRLLAEAARSLGIAPASNTVTGVEAMHHAETTSLKERSGEQAFPVLDRGPLQRPTRAGPAFCLQPRSTPRP
jgi:MFS family permease